MTSKTFTSGTVIDSTWLNDVNGATYNGSGVYTPAGTGAVATTVQAQLRNLQAWTVNVKDAPFYAKGDGTTDDTAAIQAAINSLSTTGGVVYIPAGQYKLTSIVTMASGISLIGDGQIQGTLGSRQAVTSLLGAHTGAAILSLKGCIGCTLSDFGLQSLVTNVPQFGLVLGRSSAASAGYHKINNVSVYGYYTKAAVYSIASEDNTWDSLNVYLNGGGAKYCLYTGMSDALASGLSLTTSSNLENTFIHPMFFSSSTDTNAACIFIQGAQSVGSWSFIGGYLTAYAGSYIHIDSGSIDSLNCLGPFTFVGMSGEILAGGDPIYGVRLTSTGTRTLPGLTILGMRLAFLSGATHYQIIQPGNLYLESPNIHIQPPEAFPYALCSLQRTLIKNGNVTVGRSSEWTTPTLSGAWVNTYGAPAAQVGYLCDGFGVVRVRGTVQGGAGPIFTLPFELWPASDMYYPTYAGGIIGRLKVTASTGIVSFQSGTNTEVDLSTVQFKIN